MMAGRSSQLTGRSRLASLREQHNDKAAEMAAERDRMAALKDRQAVVVSSFNLFPTPPDIADLMASMFDDFGEVLEPSAGTGRLYEAVKRADREAAFTLIDISPDCCEVLKAVRTTLDDHTYTAIRQADFLTIDPERYESFNSVIMNPPFKNGADVKHIRHALSFLRPGGRLVSLCANGPRQRQHLQPMADEWIELPAGSFKSEGTGVDVAILVIDRK